MTDPPISPEPDKFVLGHEMIDATHRKLKELASDVQGLISSGGDSALIAARLSDFHLHLADHCAREEELQASLPMDIYASSIASHRRAHDILIGKVWTVAYRAAVGDFDLLARRDFGLAVLELLRHQIVDDAALVGTLIREGLLHISPSVPLTEGEA